MPEGDGGQHDRFLGRLRASSEAVYAVGYWLYNHGREFRIPPIRYAPSAAEAYRYLDDGDLVIIEPNGSEKIVQVKHLTYPFTGRADWPFKEVFVGSKASIDRLFAAVHIHLNPDMTSAVIITADSRPHWRVTEVLARNTGNIEVKYACPLEHVSFRRLPPPLTKAAR